MKTIWLDYYVNVAHTLPLNQPAPLNVQIGLPIIRVELGHSLTLNCTVTGGPIKSIEWLHNGRPISSAVGVGVAMGGGSGNSGAATTTTLTGFRVRLISREVLHIAKVTRADKGMYQCIAFNDFDSAQAQIQLELGGK